MTLRVAVIGAGIIGGDHARLIADDVSGPNRMVLCDAISNSAPHEFDTAGLVLGTEHNSTTASRGTSATAIAPVVMVLETSGGQLVNIEVNNNVGCDVRGERVGENGSVDLGTPFHAKYNRALQSATGLAEACRRQNRAWIGSIPAGAPDPKAADAWDGYCATLTAEAGVTSLETRARATIETAEMPQLHANRCSNTTWEGAAE